MTTLYDYAVHFSDSIESREVLGGLLQEAGEETFFASARYFRSAEVG
jgi:hypothetical protein